MCASSLWLQCSAVYVCLCPYVCPSVLSTAVNRFIICQSVINVCLSVCLPDSLTTLTAIHSCSVHLLPACLSVCLSVCLSICLSVCLLISLSVSLLICLSACLSVCLSVNLSVCLSVNLFVCQSVCVSVCLCVCVSVNLSVCLSICLCVCQSVVTHSESCLSSMRSSSSIDGIPSLLSSSTASSLHPPLSTPSTAGASTTKLFFPT